MENIYDLFYQKLKGYINSKEFSEKYNNIIFDDIKDINSNELYGNI